MVRAALALLCLTCSFAPAAFAKKPLYFICSVNQGMKHTDVVKLIPSNGQASFVVPADFVKGATVKFDITPTGKKNEYYLVTTTKVPSAAFAKAEKTKFSDKINGTTPGFQKGTTQV